MRPLPYFNAEDDCWYVGPQTRADLRLALGRTLDRMWEVNHRSVEWRDPANANMTFGVHPVVTREEDMIDFRPDLAPERLRLCDHANGFCMNPHRLTTQ